MTTEICGAGDVTAESMPAARRTPRLACPAVRPLGEVFRPIARRAVAVAETRQGAVGVFLAALAVWWLEALVIPLAQGRDFATYLGAYVELFQSNPVDLGYVLDRTPLATLFIGGTLDVARGELAEPAVSLLYAGSITAWFLAGRSFGGRVALPVAVVLLAWPGYGILFHELSSDAASAAAFAGWSLLVVRVLRAPTPRRLALVGVGLGALALVRPGNIALVVLAVIPLLSRAPWRTRVLSAAAFVLPAVAIAGAWAIHNGVRYGDYTLARGGNATVPFYRTFVTDKIVRPSNGPASRELAQAVQRDLLPKEPYRSYGITLHDFFWEASPRMQADLLALSDRIKGWHSDHRWLREVGLEAVRAHPPEYARGVATSVWELLRQPVYRPLGSGEGSATTGGTGSGAVATTTVGRRLPKPTEGEPIPAPHEGGVTTPDGSIYTVWTSPTQHHLVFVHPGQERRYVALHRRMNELASRLPDRNGNATLALRFNQAARWYPPAALWLVLGLVGLAVRPPSGARALATPAVAAFVVIVLSALGLPAEPHYSMPVAPAFLLLAAGALLGKRRDPWSGSDTVLR